MKNNVTKAAILLGVVTLVAMVLVFPNRAEGQSAGNNAVYNSSGTCSPTCAASTAFIDASVLFQSDICTTIYHILKPATYSASVIDARGISGTAALTCPANTTPWLNGGTFLNKPSTILLPAGTIVISTGWVLPASTHLSGQGDNIASGTVIQAATANVGDVIAYCSSTLPPPNPSPSSCTGIAVEKLVLDGNGNSVDGIVNYWAGSLSYVDHLSLYRITGTGLVVGGVASGSGPYSNINFNTGSATASSSTVCAQIIGQPATGFTGTAGIRGLTCTSNPDARNAVLLDSSSNSLKDVTIDGFYNGIVVGSNSEAHSNVLINISGDTGTGGLPVNVVVISNNNSVTDVSILGVQTLSGGGQYAIDDQVTSTLVSDSSVGLYVLGGSANGGYSRFTTSPKWPTWATGTSSPQNSPSCAQGSLYSCTSMSSSSCGSFALWGCPVPGGTWMGIK